MRCPYCGADDSKVIDSRPTEDGEKIRRRRECLSCKNALPPMRSWKLCPDGHQKRPFA